MKKMKLIKLFAVFTVISVLLCSCSIIDAIKRIFSGNAGTGNNELMQSLAAGNVDLDSLSLDELLKLYDEFLEDGNEAFNDGAEYDLFYRDIDLESVDASSEIGFDLPENAQRATFSDDEWIDKTFEALDPTANMSSEDKAEYESMIQSLDNFDANEFQSEIDEMLKGIDGFEDYDPGEYTVSYEWPDNEITKQVPKPPFENPMIIVNDDSITVMQTGSTAEEAMSYAQQLKNAGFTKDVAENTQNVAGYSIYTFTAENGNGLSVSLTCASGTITVNISK